ncbi:MAG TPA: BRO family protein [Klebsiella sp.]|jgi:prophage antirepressor-like protein
MVSKNGKTRQCANTNRVSIENIRVGNIDMNIVAKSDYNFQGFAFNPVTDGGSIWFTSTELAKALGYKKTDAISQIYARNADEFSESMSLTLNMKVNGINNSLRNKSVRVYSLRGAHLVAMFASTPKAKEFRRWVLDIIDREVNDGNNSPLFSGSVLLEFENGVMTNTKVAQPGERLISVKTLVELMQMNGYVMTTKEEIKGKVLDAIEKLH